MALIEFFIRFWALALCIGALIPFIREQTWWLRAWTYARLQMLFLCSMTAIVFILLPGLDIVWDKIIFGLLIVLALGCVWDILPFTPILPKQTRDFEGGEPHINLRLFVGNVLIENEAYADYLAQIKVISPDLIFLVETDETWRDMLSELEALYAHRYLLPLPEFNGMLFYSRFPILEAQERYLVQDHIPSLTLDLDVGHTQKFRFYGVHPRPPRPEDDTSDLDKELSFIANEVGHLGNPTIVTGDLNDVGWSSTTKKFLRVSGLSDPRHGRGLYNSYNAKNPFVRWPLDHLFHSKHFSLISMKRLQPCGSDHFPLLIELALHDPARF